MKKVKILKLDVQKNGIDQYEKQSIEISRNGLITHLLYPFAVMGTLKKYEFQVEREETENFLDSFDFENWKNVDAKSYDSFSFNLSIKFDDDSYLKKEGYINLSMPEEYVNFDEKILDLVMFIEKPWLFTK